MKTKSSIFYGWWIVLVCTLIQATFFAFLFSSISLFIVPVTEGLGISRSAFGTFSTLVSLTSTILSPFAGKICAKKDLRLLMSGSLLVGVIGYTCMSFINGIGLLYVLAVVIGICGTFCTTLPMAILLTRWFVDKRGTAMSITFAGSAIGSTLLSSTISRIITGMGWRMAFRIQGLGMLVVIVPLVFLVLRSAPEDKGLTALGADKAPAAGTAAAKAEEGIPLKELRKKGVFWIFVSGLFIAVLTMGSTYHMAPDVTLRFDAATAARFVAIYSLIAIFGKLLMGVVFDKWGIKAGILFGTLSMALCFVALIVANSFMLLLVVALFFGLGSGLGTIFPPQLTSRIFGTKYYGEIYGVVNLFVCLSMAANNLVMASIYDVTGTYTLAWIFGFAASVIAAVMLLISIRGAKKLLQDSTGA